MKITSAKFVKGVVSTDDSLSDGIPQIAFIGRSNVGKSSIINSLTHQNGLAKTSSFPGRTQQINLFLVNNSVYFVDLPGYGFAKASKEVRERILKLISWYLFDSGYKQKKIVFIMDANTGPSHNDMEILRGLMEDGKHIIIVANKVDKLKNSEYKRRLQSIENISEVCKVIPYSSNKKIGISELTNEILK